MKGEGGEDGAPRGKIKPGFQPDRIALDQRLLEIPRFAVRQAVLVDRDPAQHLRVELPLVAEAAIPDPVGGRIEHGGAGEIRLQQLWVEVDDRMPVDRKPAEGASRGGGNPGFQVMEGGGGVVDAQNNVLQVVFAIGFLRPRTLLTRSHRVSLKVLSGTRSELDADRIKTNHKDTTPPGAHSGSALSLALASRASVECPK